MKISTFTLKTTVAATMLLAAPFAQAETTKITVNGMVCAFCAQGIETALTAMPETKAVFVDLAGKVVAVESKDGMKLNPAKIKKEIEDAGYDTVKFESITQTVAQFKASAKKSGK
jgi:copper chaperone CopZ